MTTGRPLLYLASHSPRRRELLRQINVRFETLLLRSDRMRGSDVEEIPRAGEAPTDYVTRITLEKARMGAARARERRLSRHVALRVARGARNETERADDAAALARVVAPLVAAAPSQLTRYATSAGGAAFALGADNSGIQMKIIPLC
jgi:hypothetical protein